MNKIMQNIISINNNAFNGIHIQITDFSKNFHNCIFLLFHIYASVSPPLSLKRAKSSNIISSS